MAETPYNHYALYEPDASPDLTATGEYNSAIIAIDSDMHSERMEREQEDTNLQIAIDNETDTRKAEDAKLDARITELGNKEAADIQGAREERTRIEREYKEADTALDAKIQAEEMARVSADSGLATDIDNEKKARLNADNALADRITAEQKARADADSSLGKRIDNAEVEISANSADLTGIKSLTYGTEHVQFLEHDNGSYSSPALDEIDEQIKTALEAGFTIVDATASSDYAALYATAKQHAPRVMLRYAGEGSTSIYAGGQLYMCVGITASTVHFASPMPLPDKAHAKLIYGGVAVSKVILTASGINGGVDYAPMTLKVSKDNDTHISRLNMVTSALRFNSTQFTITTDSASKSVDVALADAVSGITADTQWGTIEA